MSVARASLVAITQWCAPEDQRLARLLPEGQVPHALARILVEYNLNPRSPWLTEAGCIVADPAKLTHGSKPADISVAANNWTRQAGGNLTGAQLLAKSLRVPPYGNIHLVADSTLRLTPSG